MNFSPIIIFVYNRLHHLNTLFNSLQKNDLFKKSKVIVFSDGAKNEIDKDKIDKVRELLKKRLIPKNSEIIENNVNLGLSRNVIGGLNKIFQIYDRAIILEDDLELSPFFLNYMNDALNLYATSENVASISGYMYPIEPKKFSNNYFFLKLIESWGWGTWRRSWKNMEINPKKLKDRLELKGKIEEFNLGDGAKYYQMLLDNILKKNNSWAIRWYASNFLKDMVTLFPKRSFVRNIGVDGSGIHCGFSNTFDTDLLRKYRGIQIKKIEEVYSDREQLKFFFERTRFKRFIQNSIGRVKNIINF